MTKKCYRCKENLPFKDFAKDKNGKYGLQSKCRQCCSELNAEWRQKNAEKRKQYFEENKDHHNKINQEWYYKNREKRIKQTNEYRDKNRERLNEANRLRRKANPDKQEKARQEYYARYPEKKKAYSLSNSPKYSKSGYDKHHWSYAEKNAKSLIYLKKRDHYDLHNTIEYAQEHFCYISDSGVLLDTKEKHIKHIESLGINYEL